MKSFGISSFNLQKLNSYEEKQSYIIECMQKTVDSLLDKWKQRHISRKKLNEIETEKFNNLKIQFQKGKRDQFSWLNIKTR